MVCPYIFRKRLPPSLLSSRYPIGTLFSRQHAQHIDIIHTIHTMHKGGAKPSGLEYVIILMGQKDILSEGFLLWEQEAGAQGGSSNPPRRLVRLRRIQILSPRPII
jgi:hypothetical protein